MSGTTLGLLGSSSVALTSCRPSFDPSAGSVWELEFEGSRDAIRIASLSWQAAGGRVRIDESGPISRATAVFSGNRNPSDPSAPISSETPTDRYEIRTERVEISLFSLPKVMKEAESYIGIAQYRSDIESAVRDGSSLSISAQQFPLAHQLYKKLARGQETFPTPRFNLVRVRTYTTTYQQRTRLQAIPPIWRTPALVSAFALPLAVTNILPVDPGIDETPPGTVWGWMLTDDSASYVPKTNQVEEHKAWAFAAWDTDIYPIL